MAGDTALVTNLTLDPACTFTIDADSRLRIADGGTVRMGAKTLPRVELTGNITWYDGGTITSMATAGTGLDTIKYEPLKKYAFTAIDSADWNGADNSNRNYFRSATAGQRCTLDFDATKHFSYTAWKDVVSPDTIFLNDGTNISNGGNIWP
jgi:hypothetical protein